MAELKAFEHLLAQDKISRRNFLSRLSAIGIAASLLPTFSFSQLQATPKKGGRFRLGMGGAATTDCLDPAKLNGAMAMNVNWQIRNCLFEVDHKGKLVPELAKGWDATPDATKWIFKLRQGVEFHNGKTLEADDVVFSINHHRGKNSTSVAKSLVGPIEDIKIDDKHTIAVCLREGNAEFPFILSDPHLTIVPAETKQDEWEQGLGTGGFILHEWEPGFRAFTKRNPNYWKEARAYFEEVETIGIADATLRANELINGKIDAMNRVRLDLMHLLPRASDIQIINRVGTKHYSIPMLTDREPFNNNDVRMALKCAVDREHLLKYIVREYGTLGNDHPVAPCQKYYASELPQRTYDPDLAKFHMRKAGMLNETFRLHTSHAAWPGVDSVAAAMLYREHAATAGIKIEVIIEPDAGYWDKVWLKKPCSMCFCSGRSTVDWMLSTAYAVNSAWNDTCWKNNRFNILLKEARAELDETKRHELYYECQRILNLEGGVIIPTFANIIDAASERLNINNPASNWEVDGHRAAERWWFS